MKTMTALLAAASTPPGTTISRYKQSSSPIYAKPAKKHEKSYLHVHTQQTHELLPMHGNVIIARTGNSVFKAVKTLTHTTTETVKIFFQKKHENCPFYKTVQKIFAVVK